MCIRDRAEGELTVYGSCEEAYLNAACDKFQELYGITVNRQRLSTGEVAAKIEEENDMCIRYRSSGPLQGACFAGGRFHGCYVRGVTPPRGIPLQPPSALPGSQSTRR